MFDCALLAYIVAVGFTGAGLCLSFCQLVTGRPLAFAVEPGNGPGSLAGIFARVLAGPAILMRNAIRATLGGCDPLWLALATLICSLWSFFSGVVILELVLRLSR